ncbi:MAG: T9SS type A sorting domain-containing protein, partial [Bacteroidota bacterium]
LPHPTSYTIAHCTIPSPADEEVREDDFGSLIDDAPQQINPDYSGYEEQIQYASKEKFYATVKQDSTILDAGTTDDVEYANLYVALEQTNIAKLQEVKSIVDSKDYSLALQKLLALADSNVMEHNKKIALKVFMESIAIDTVLDSGQVALLEPISHMHPIIGGEAVFWACAMLDKDVNNDLPPLRKGGIPDFTTNEFNVRIFPNPAGDILYINYQKDATLVLNITDITGKIVLTKNLGRNADYESVNTASMPAGSYTISVLENGKTGFTDKLIIIR